MTERASLFAFLHRWWGFLLYVSILFAFFIGLSWPRWWLALVIEALVVGGSLGHRELKRRHPDAF